jgi:hypothetical protein
MHTPGTRLLFDILYDIYPSGAGHQRIFFPGLRVNEYIALDTFVFSSAANHKVMIARLPGEWEVMLVCMTQHLASSI